ncbi:MAG: release factor glutamine methyltransferase [Tepidanaerobacteraceae bacterium]|nr:release factor glutamine methyltransferase [Tepidanaerobacteraceae bacterium]
MNVQKALVIARKRLIEAGVESPELDAELLLAHALSVNRLRLLVNSRQKLADEDIKRFERFLDLRRRHVPVAYITGHKEFFGLDISVGPGVLIPRPETEFLVEASLRAAEGVESPRIADVCCGSGAIAVALAKNRPDAVVFASDISDAAEKYTKKNAIRHHVEDRVFFLKGDLWQPFEEKKVEPFDVVVSNPPYIPEREMKYLPEDVKHEPQLALNGGEDGLDFYRRILLNVQKFVKPQGHVVFEIGWNQAAAVGKLLEDAGFCRICIAKDYAGFDRVVCASRSY